jgi:hypothetical protein
MYLLKTALIVVLLVVFYQDYKDRMVFWFLYPIMGILAGIIHVLETSFFMTFLTILINLSFIVIILGTCFLYAKWKLKKHFTQEVFGLGDILFFIFISATFSSISFIILLVFALLFSLGLHLVLAPKSKHNTVPLAGYMALFFGAVYTLSLLIDSPFLYAY